MGYSVQPLLFYLGLLVFVVGALALYVGLQTYIGIGVDKVYQPEVPIGIMLMVVGFVIMIGSHLVKVHQEQLSRLRTISHTNTV